MVSRTQGHQGKVRIFGPGDSRSWWWWWWLLGCNSGTIEANIFIYSAESLNVGWYFSPHPLSSWGFHLSTLILFSFICQWVETVCREGCGRFGFCASFFAVQKFFLHVFCTVSQSSEKVTVRIRVLFLLLHFHLHIVQSVYWCACCRCLLLEPSLHLPSVCVVSLEWSASPLSFPCCHLIGSKHAKCIYIFLLTLFCLLIFPLSSSLT